MFLFAFVGFYLTLSLDKVVKRRSPPPLLKPDAESKTGSVLANSGITPSITILMYHTVSYTSEGWLQVCLRRLCPAGAIE